MDKYCYCVRSSLFIVFLLVPVFLPAQSKQLDDLRVTLFGTDGKPRVRVLNELSRNFIFYYVHTDSALSYASRAGEEAKTIQDRDGLAYALLLRGYVQGRLLGHLDSMEILTRQAIGMLEASADKENLSYAYSTLASCLVSKGRDSLAEIFIRKALPEALNKNDSSGLGWAYYTEGFLNVKKGNYWKAFENLIKGREIGAAIKDSVLQTMSTAFIGRAFNHAGDPAKALDYYFDAWRLKTAAHVWLWPHFEDVAYAYWQLGKTDSAVYYQKRHLNNIDSLTTDARVREKFRFNLLPDLDAYQLVQEKKFDEALARLLPGLEKQQKYGDLLGVMYSLLSMTIAYEGNHSYQNAILRAKELLKYARRVHNNYFQLESCRLLVSVYEKLDNTDSAYAYYREYTSVKTRVNENQFLLRAAVYTANAASEKRMELLRKDGELQSKQLELNKKELERNSQIQKIMLVALAAVLLFSLIVIRNFRLKRKNEQLRIEQQQAVLQKRSIELEMQALRAQMNPHFIFNCLNAIDNLIQTGEGEKATEYLAGFARLIRMILDSSKNNLVPFHKDLELIKLYLELERFRCNYKFDYEIAADDVLMNGDYKVPPMIVQPFIENAIQHGLINKKNGDRKLQVQARLKDDYIVYEITDNGIGRQEAARIKQRNHPGHHSYGIGISRDRVHLHNLDSQPGDVMITDLRNGTQTGTRVTIKVNTAYERSAT